MASGNKKRHSCGHRNFGLSCHRCEFADKLEKLAAAKKNLVTCKKLPKPKRWTIEEMLAEVKRLRSEGRR